MDEPDPAPVGQCVERGILALGIGRAFACHDAVGRRRLCCGAELRGGGSGEQQGGEPRPTVRFIDPPNPTPFFLSLSKDAHQGRLVVRQGHNERNCFVLISY
jgi:hypothetical protein